MPIVLTNAQTRFLRGQAHGLKAILQVGGKGISQTLVDEVISALEHHELIKVKALVQRIGHVAILYRPSTDHRHIVLPRA